MAKGAVLTRWFQLLTAIQSGRPHTAQDLAERLGVTTRTIYRDVRQLEEAGVPIFFDSEHKGYRLTDTFQIRPLQFQPDELTALVAMIGFMRRRGPMATRDTAHALVDKLLAALPIGHREAASVLDRSLSMDPSSAHGLEDDHVVAELNRALRIGHKARIRYATFSRGGAESSRVIHPYGLAFRGTSLYLIGYCELRMDRRNFRVGRIREIQVLRESFVPDPTFDLEEYLQAVWGITDGPEMSVKLRFEPDVAPLARETRWHPTQAVADEPDGGAILTMVTRGRAELARWIAGFGGRVRVLAPDDLREDVCAIGRGIVAVCGPSTNG